LASLLFLWSGFDLLALSFVLLMTISATGFPNSRANLDRHFLILDAVVQQMSTGWRATQNKTANSYVVAIVI
jgi:hypothetical protein